MSKRLLDNDLCSNVEMSPLYETSHDEDNEKQKSVKKKSVNSSKKSCNPPLDDNSQEEETKPYLIVCANQIATIQENLVKIGITEPLVSAVEQNTPREDGNIASTATSLATKPRSTDISNPDPSSTSASSTSAPKQKSPCIVSRTVDLAHNEEDQAIIPGRSSHFTLLLSIESHVNLSTSNLDTMELPG